MPIVAPTSYASVERQYSSTSGLYFIAGGRSFYASQYGSGRAAEDAANAYLVSLGKAAVPVGQTPYGQISAKEQQLASQHAARAMDPGDIAYYQPGGAGYREGRAITINVPTVQAIAERPATAITPGSEVAGIKAQVGQITAPVSHPMISGVPAPSSIATPITFPSRDVVHELGLDVLKTVAPPGTKTLEQSALEHGISPLMIIPIYAVRHYTTPIEEAKLYPAHKESQEFGKRITEGAEKYLIPYVPYTLGGVARPEESKKLVRGIVGGAASIPELAATTGLGYELIARDIITGKPVKGVGTRIATGIGMTATEMATQFKEEPIETTGQFIGQSLVLGGVGRGIKEIKIPEIKTPEFGAFRVRYSPPKTFAKILPTEYPETIGFTGKLMSFKEAKINIPETRPIIKPVEPVKLMGFEKAQISIPEIVKGMEKSAIETPIMSFKEAKPIIPEILQKIGESSKEVQIMSFKEAKPIIPEIIQNIGKQAKEAPIMSFKEAKPFTPETSIKPIEIKPVPGGEARAKAYGEWYIQTKFPEERFNVGGGAIQPTYLRNIGIRANVPPKVAEPLFDIRTGGFVASDILKTASKGQLFMKEPPRITVKEIPAKIEAPIGKQSKMSLDERIKKDWEKRDRENRKLMKSGFQTTSEGQILLQKQKVEVLDLTKLDEKIKQIEKSETKAIQKQRAFPLILPVVIPKQATRATQRYKQILTPRQIYVSKPVSKPMSASSLKNIFKTSEISLAGVSAISVLKPESIAIQTPISVQKAIQREAQREAQKEAQREQQIEKQIQEFWIPEPTITEPKLSSDVTEQFFRHKRRKGKQKYKPQKIYAPVLNPLWDIAGFQEKALKPIRLKTPNIIDITKPRKHRRTKRR